MPWYGCFQMSYSQQQQQHSKPFGIIIHPIRANDAFVLLIHAASRDCDEQGKSYANSHVILTCTLLCSQHSARRQCALIMDFTLKLYGAVATRGLPYTHRNVTATLLAHFGFKEKSEKKKKWKPNNSNIYCSVLWCGKRRLLAFCVTLRFSWCRLVQQQQAVALQLSKKKKQKQRFMCRWAQRMEIVFHEWWLVSAGRRNRREALTYSLHDVISPRRAPGWNKQPANTQKQALTWANSSDYWHARRHIQQTSPPRLSGCERDATKLTSYAYTLTCNVA